MLGCWAGSGGRIRRFVLFQFRIHFYFLQFISLEMISMSAFETGIDAPFWKKNSTNVNSNININIPSE